MIACLIYLPLEFDDCKRIGNPYGCCMDTFQLCTEWSFLCVCRLHTLVIVGVTGMWNQKHETSIHIDWWFLISDLKETAQELWCIKFKTQRKEKWFFFILKLMLQAILAATLSDCNRDSIMFYGDEYTLCTLQRKMYRLCLCQMRVIKYYVKLKHHMRHEIKVDKILSYCEALWYM